MQITGKQLIGGEWVLGEAGTFHGVNPGNGEHLQPPMSIASSNQVETAVRLAAEAGQALKHTSLSARAKFLRNCADQIMAIGDILLERISAETGYNKARAEGERGRTCGQLRMFASYIESGDYLDARIDTAMPDRKPLPSPDLRHLNLPIGPVVVFGASNFPMAFSVGGGDTASALAAGCPVIVKGHPSHAGTGELVAQAIAAAVTEAGLPPGTFSLLTDSGHSVGSQLVQAPEVKAVGFTGSWSGGMALVKLANARPEPIPVFAEMSSINPVFLLPEALKADAAAIARGFYSSFTLGSGQFCVKPGLVIAVDGEPLQTFISTAKQLVEDAPAAIMLNGGICNAFGDAVAHRQRDPALEVLAKGAKNQNAEGFYSQVTLYAMSAAAALTHDSLSEETFGPAAIIIKCRNKAEMLEVAAKLKGQLATAVHGTESEFAEYGKLLNRLAEISGRVVINGFPTGVEVCHSMMHGGPYPATSDSRFTSVGSNAIVRFLRPVCYQNCPESLLPPALRNDNPWGITRMVNGAKTDTAIN